MMVDPYQIRFITFSLFSFFAFKVKYSKTVGLHRSNFNSFTSVLVLIIHQLWSFWKMEEMKITLFIVDVLINFARKSLEMKGKKILDGD